MDCKYTSATGLSSKNRDKNIPLDGIKKLWQQTLGDDRVRIAILDSPVDKTHPSLINSRLLLGYESCSRGGDHGTHVTSIILGQHSGPVFGIAPDCSGIIIPVFDSDYAGFASPCSQIDLARGVLTALQNQAQIINISGGQFVPSGAAHPILADAVQQCLRNNVLIVASVGNDSCECLHVPAALPGVLAVGAVSSAGVPMDFSNWGSSYQKQGILAPGENIEGAKLGGGTVSRTGSSFATAIVSGVAALLLSVQIKHNKNPDPQEVRSVILRGAVECELPPCSNIKRCLVGRLHLERSFNILLRDMAVAPPNQVPDLLPASASSQESLASGEVFAKPNEVGPANGVSPAACSCGIVRDTPVQLVYAIGQLGFDFVSEARRDSIRSRMPANTNPYALKELISYLENNRWDLAAIAWTLSLDATPIYAIQPAGVFGSDAYQQLFQFLKEQLNEGVERISLAGVITGQTRLLSGQKLPTVQPDLRGMFSWSTKELVNSAIQSSSKAAPRGEKSGSSAGALSSFLERIYSEFRNLGITSQERALNHAATNAFSAAKIFEAALKDNMQLDTIEIERSPVCRPDSDCWDVKLIFFDPEKLLERARKLYRYTVDVSDVVPVVIGPVRSWSVR